MRGAWVPVVHTAGVLLIVSLSLYGRWRRKEEKRLLRQQAHQEVLIDLMSKAMLISTAGLEELRLLVPQLVGQFTRQPCHVTVCKDELILFEAGQENEGPKRFSLEFNGTTIELGEEPSSAALSALGSLAVTLAERVEAIQTTLRDDHTKLYGKGHLLEALDYEFERARRYGHEVSVILLDVDFFKKHNDRYGHPSGDKALRSIAAILERHHRRYDTVARYGGEEFALLLPETGSTEAYELAEILRKEVAAHRFEGESSTEFVRLTISLGIATFPSVGESPDELLKLADKALYVSKNAGRDCTNIAN